MASKKEEPKKPYRLPAIGKPKEKLVKSSVKELGVKANEEYKKGFKNSVKVSFGPKKGQVMSEKDFVKYRHNFHEAVFGPKKNQVMSEKDFARDRYRFQRDRLTGTDKKFKEARDAEEKSREILSRQTGMAKGGLAVKSNAKKK